MLVEEADVRRESAGEREQDAEEQCHRLGLERKPAAVHRLTLILGSASSQLESVRIGLARV
jgi:hypothetical protein